MLAELGHRADAVLIRGTDALREAAHATLLHLRRVGGAVSVALARVTREAQDLVWDYQDVASDLRRRDRQRVSRSPHAPLGQESDDAENGPPVLRVVHSGE